MVTGANEAMLGRFFVELENFASGGIFSFGAEKGPLLFFFFGHFVQLFLLSKILEDFLLKVSFDCC